MAVWDPTAAWPTDTCSLFTRFEEAHASLLVNFADYSGDPTSGWGDTERGTWLLDDGWSGAGIGTDLTPRLAIFQKVASAGTNGKRYCCLRYRKYIETWVAITTPFASAFSADSGWTDLDLTSELDGANVQDFDDLLVSEAILRVRCRTGASETLGADNAYVGFRKKGTTNDGERLYAQVQNRWAERTITVPLDTTETLQWEVVVGGGTEAFEVECELIGFMEPI